MTTPSLGRWLRARSRRSKVRCSSTSPTARPSCAAFSTRTALPRCGRSRACFTAPRRASTTPRAPSPWSGRNSAEQPSIKLGRMDRRHLYVLIEKFVGVGRLDVVRPFHLQILVDQLVVVGHALVVVPAERHRARSLVVHQDGDEVPVVELVLV